MKNAFSKSFSNYVCEGDKITGTYEGWKVTARIARDDSIDAPDERDDGFWPSLDPDECGYIGSNDQAEFERQQANALKVLAAWENDEWFYRGVVISVARPVKVKGRVIDEIVLSDHAASLWGIECNFPESDNSYLTEVANGLLPEAVEFAGECLRQMNAKAEG